MLKKTENLTNAHVLQFLKFGLVGVSNTLIGLAVYYVCLHLIDLSPQLSNLACFVISVANAYFWNLRWVFKTNSSNIKVIKFLSVYCFSYLLSAGLLYIWVDVLQINASIAPLLSLFITIPTNYLLSKYWAFKGENNNDRKKNGAGK